MFENILLPASSEFYPGKALERGASLAKIFGSRITVLYVMEEKALDNADRVSDAFRSYYEREETKSEVKKEHLSTADKIIFDSAKKFFEDKNISFDGKVAEGEFSDAIRNELDRDRYDLILTGYERGCLLHYRIIDNSRVPIWVESGSGNSTILAVCSNLAPNQKVPQMSITLARSLGWKLYMLYVVDTQDSVEVDENGNRSGTKSEKELTDAGEEFLGRMKELGIDTRLVTGSIERETVKAARKVGAGLVVVGREQKKNGVLGLPVKSIKKKLAEKCEYSILFIN